MTILNFKFKILNLNAGFTLAEVVLAMGIISLLFGFVIINLGRVTRTTSVITSADVLISDLRAQQEKAMSGVSTGGAGGSFGVYLDQDKYTLFAGSSYSPSDPSNFVKTLPQNISVSSIAFPQSEVIFSSRSGEIAGYSETGSTITIENTAGSEQLTIKLNKYGVVREIN